MASAVVWVCKLVLYGKIDLKKNIYTLIREWQFVKYYHDRMTSFDLPSSTQVSSQRSRLVSDGFARVFTGTFKLYKDAV